MRRQVADLDDAIGLQIEAIEKGIEPELVGQRIMQLRAEKERIEEAQRALQLDVAADHSQLAASLERMPDLTKQLRRASPEVKRALFDAFELRIVYDKPNNRVQISATITEEVAEALGSATELPQEPRTEGHGGGRIEQRATRDVSGLQEAFSSRRAPESGTGPV